MALKKDMTLTNNFNEQSIIKNAYIQIHRITGNKNSLNVEFFVKREDKVNVLERRDFYFVPSVQEGSANFIKQAYEHLKTMPEFSGATDC